MRSQVFLGGTSGSSVSSMSGMFYKGSVNTTYLDEKEKRTYANKISLHPFPDLGVLEALVSSVHEKENWNVDI